MSGRQSDKERGDKADRSERADRDRDRDREKNTRTRRESRGGEVDGPSTEKVVASSRPDSGKSAELVDVTTSKSFSRRCVVPTLAAAVLFSIGLGAALFILIYYLVVLMHYCPWTQLETGCYQFFQDSKDWYSAQTICKKRGGRLAELSGFDKHTDVVTLFSQGGHSPSCFWVGGFESGEMSYTWNVSRRVMSQYFTEWESGYPKNRSEPTCVDFCHPDFSWKNKKCFHKQHYVCEFG